jgi:hypothetical protein
MCRGLQRQQGASDVPLRVVRGNKFDQSGPWHHLVHLIQKLTFLDFLEAQIEVQGCLFHAANFHRQGLLQTHKRGTHAELS